MLRAFTFLARSARRPLAIAILSMTAALVACSDDSSQPAVAPTGPSHSTVSGAVIAVSESTFNFGAVAIGDKSATHAYTIMNVGVDPLYISYITWSGLPWQIDRTASPWCVDNVAMAPGTSCVVATYFEPTAVGPASTQFTVHSNGGDVTFQGTGTGFMPVEVYPQEVYFDEQAIGFQSAPQSVQIKNLSGANIVLTNLGFIGLNPGDFLIAGGSNNACQLNVPIAPSATCDVAVAFTATATGNRAATLSIESNAGKTAAFLYGTGVSGADVGVSMTGVLQGKTIVYSITIKNAGPNAASNISLVDAVPTGTTLAGITYPSGMMSCFAPPVGQTGTVSCGITSLASGASTSLQFSAKVPVPAKGWVTNTATILSQSFDPVSGNNTASVTTKLARK